MLLLIFRVWLSLSCSPLSSPPLCESVAPTLSILQHWWSIFPSLYCVYDSPSSLSVFVTQFACLDVVFIYVSSLLLLFVWSLAGTPAPTR